MSMIRSHFEGKAIPFLRDEVDTDQIVPARFLKEITFANMGHYVFYDQRFEADKSPKPHPFNDFRFLGSSVLVVGRNFGCGSSREHAPQAIMRFGIQVIIGESYAEIFAGNCKAIGVPTLRLDRPSLAALADAIELAPDQKLSIDLNTKLLRHGELTLEFDLPEAHRHAFLSGTWEIGAVLASHTAAIQKTADRLPYLNGFGVEG
jgi:3-isopropylmalate/(R)-2-methylmalate dehydratase small subunit